MDLLHYILLKSPVDWLIEDFSGLVSAMVGPCQNFSRLYCGWGYIRFSGKIP
jgi:hypothetical protein